MAALSMPYTLVRLALFILLIVPQYSAAQLDEDDASVLMLNKGNAAYVLGGLGFIDLERGTGINIPVGFTAVLPMLRLIGTVTLLDIGLLQKQQYNVARRYVRFFDSRTGRSICVDSERNVQVSDLRCNGGTDFLFSVGADLSFVPVETRFFGGRMGKVFGGLGVRFLSPKTPYATLGILYERSGGGTGGVKVAVGKSYVFAGVVWGINLKRIFSRL